MQIRRKPQAATANTTPSQRAVCCQCGTERDIDSFQYSYKATLTPKDRSWWRLVNSQPAPRRFRCVPPPEACRKLAKNKGKGKRSERTPARIISQSQEIIVGDQLVHVESTPETQRPTKLDAANDHVHAGTTETEDVHDGTDEVVAAPSVPLGTAPAHHAVAACRVIFSADGKTVFSGSKDGIVCEWDVSTWSVRRTFHHAVSNVADIALSGDSGLAAWALYDNKVELRSNESGASKEIVQTYMAESWISAASISPDNKYLVYGSNDDFVRVWDLETNDLRWKRQGHTGYISSIGFSPDCSHLATGSVDLSIQIWDLEKGSVVGALNSMEACTRAVVFSPDSTVLAAGSGSTVMLWKLPAFDNILRLGRHKDSVNTLAFSPSGHQLASGSADRTIILWNATSGQLIKQISGHGGSILSISFAPNGHTIASGSEDCTVRMWAIMEGEASGSNCVGAVVQHDGTTERTNGIKPPRVATTKTPRKLASKVSSFILPKTLPPDESEPKRCYICLGYTDGRETTERCICWS
ncbi:Guanine nucleotide-binding protein subunit beta-2-like 1 [Conoideocrella luteorostrata]|uniref:Guanine nucleotide-binding protein subunit beta-2-like 1 n=1 Tax=Conoideocrella luteorostrata TaxID=1105319 RepID=A0AAJ0G165_9HYPO|nr:Guanine nucleotide-binding protein subunit beta-2-like 1 [Conoideocrella luteorostrata]